MTKEGILFERAVSDIVKGFGNVSNVVQGEWRAGPDGRRDRDVGFSATLSGKTYKGLIECKDYDRASTGRVGIGVIDALDSKRRDLDIDIPIVCSNAGFSKPAIAKAQRVGIRTFGALRIGDDRIRFEVSDLVYSRKVSISNVQLEFRAAGQLPDLSKVAPKKILFDGNLVFDWATERIRQAVMLNPIVNADVSFLQRMAMPVRLIGPGGEFFANEIVIRATVIGAWYKHKAVIDATSGLYDWVRQRILAASDVASERILRLRELNLGGGTWIDRPPLHVMGGGPPLQPGEFDLRLILLRMPGAMGPVPPLNALLNPADVDLTITAAMPDRFSISKRGYSLDSVAKPS